MKAKLYELVSRCVLDGIQNAQREANDERGCQDSVAELSSEGVDEIHMSIMREITEYIDFQDHAK